VLIFQPTVKSRRSNNRSKQCQTVSQLAKIRNYKVSMSISVFVEGFRLLNESLTFKGPAA